MAVRNSSARSSRRRSSNKQLGECRIAIILSPVAYARTPLLGVTIRGSHSLRINVCEAFRFLTLVSSVSSSQAIASWNIDGITL